jgi:hypothetical protein
MLLTAFERQAVIDHALSAFGIAAPTVPGYTVAVAACVHTDADQTLVIACKGKHGFAGDQDALTSVYAYPLTTNGPWRKLGMPNTSGKDGDVPGLDVTLDGRVILAVGHSATNSGAQIQIETHEVGRLSPSVHLSKSPVMVSADDSVARSQAQAAQGLAQQARTTAQQAQNTAAEALKQAKARPAAPAAPTVDVLRVAQIAADVVWDKADDRIWAELTSADETAIKGAMRTLIRQVLDEMGVAPNA